MTVESDQLVVQGHDLGPVRVVRVARGGVHGADRRQDLVAAWRTGSREALADQLLALDDLPRVPGPAVLIEERDSSPLGETRASRRASVRSISASRPETSPSSGRRTRTSRASWIASVVRSWRTGSVPAPVARYPPLNARYRTASTPETRTGTSCAVGSRYGMRASLIFVFARVIRLSPIVSTIVSTPDQASWSVSHDAGRRDRTSIGYCTVVRCSFMVPMKSTMLLRALAHPLRVVIAGYGNPPTQVTSASGHRKRSRGVAVEATATSFN